MIVHRHAIDPSAPAPGYAVHARRLMPRFGLLSCLLFLASSVAAGLAPVHLRCDWMENPLGIDSAPPQLSWKLTSPDRGAAQSAWQVRAASSEARLHAGEPDLWDSGRVSGDAQLQIAYAGPRLRTGQIVHWQVRVWDGRGTVSDWSAPARWTMGVVAPENWQARWITDPGLEKVTRQPLGFSTPPETDENTTHWLTLDLGREFPLEAITLHAITHTVNERLGFPRWFRLEVARDASFRDAHVVVDHTANPINEWLTRLNYPLEQVPARYLRITTPRLRMLEEASDGHLTGRLALSQVEVRSGGANVAVGAKVTASASLEDDQWSAAAVVDGLALPEANPRASETLRLRREFNVGPGLRRALLHVTGLGHYTLRLNGEGVADADLLKPGWTEYTRTILYDTHDITARLQPGANALGLTLAGGMYNVPAAPGRYTKFVGPPRALKALAQLRLEYADGRVETIVTDESWRAAPGPATFAHVYGGEDHDAGRETPGWDRAGFDDRAWTRAAVTRSPGGALRGASFAAPALRTHEVLPPVAVREVRPGVAVYDFGQNAAMMPRLRARGPAGATVKLLPAELVNADGTIDKRSTHSGRTEAAWNYRLAGAPGGESWQPSFFYHGARYLQVEVAAPAGGPLPLVERLESLVFSTSAAPAGHFASSHELLNRIRELIRWAQRSNLVSVLTDCPHRERLGWLEQYHLNGPAIRSEFDLTRLFAKTFNDMADAQAPNGLVPSISPEYVRFPGFFRDSPEWGSALILAAWQQYEWTGDVTTLRRHYGSMQRYFEFLTARADAGILSHGLGDWYDLGPARPGVSQLTPIPLVATAIYHEDALVLARIARRLGHHEDAARYEHRAQDIASAFNARFLDAASGRYATGSQAAQALPLVIGLAPVDQRDAVLARLVEAVAAAGTTNTTGDVGHRYLLNALAGNGRSNLVFALATQDERPGYAYQLARGATSLTEAWDAGPHSSQNHFMLGHLMEWLHGHLAGLSPDPDAPGFARAIARPDPVEGVTWAESSRDTVRGRFAVRWERTGTAGLVVHITVPPNARASVHLPVPAGATVTESGRPAANHPDLLPAGIVRGRPTWEIGSGTYRFEVRP